MAGLVVFGGESFTHTGQAVYMNDVWLYTPHTGKWREVRLETVVSACHGELVKSAVQSNDNTYFARFAIYIFNPFDSLGRACSLDGLTNPSLPRFFVFLFGKTNT